MYHPKTRWTLAAAEQAENSETEALAAVTGVHPIIARLLQARGLDSREQVAQFLDVSPEAFNDPFAMYGMDVAVDRIRRAVDHREKIWIYGDYDVDGVTSTSLMLETFRALGHEVDFYIPNRFTEGYGLNGAALNSAAERGVTLVITVDTGISAVKEAEIARALGLDLIITDHHEPPPELPDAYAVINPKHPLCRYPDHMLAGVGVAFKMAHALLGRVPEELLPLAAVGTIADLVPLADENRLLAALGLKKLNERRHIGLTALLEVAGIDANKEVTAGHIGFSIGPRLNASGRLHVADPAVKLLTTRDRNEAYALAQQLDAINRERQQIVDEITKEAIALVEKDKSDNQYAIVVARPGWNAGVIGIVASRLVERYYRPTIVLAIDEASGQAKGSARSIEGFDMFQALSELQELLPHFGGHTMAAGMTLAVDDIGELRQRLNGIAADWLSEEDFIPSTTVDLSCTLADLSLEWVEQLSLLEPYGIGNRTPRFCLTGGQLGEVKRIGRDQSHLRLSLRTDADSVQAVAFQMGAAANELAVGAEAEVVGELSVNEWNGHRSVQCIVQDIEVAHLQLFDWRGRKVTSEDWQQLADNGTVFNCFHPLSAAEARRQLPGREASLVLWDGYGHVVGDGSDGTSWGDTNRVEDGDRSEVYTAGTVGESSLKEEASADKHTTAVPPALADSCCLAFVDYPTDKATYHRILRAVPTLERVYFFGADEALYAVPSRDDFKKVYAVLHKERRMHKGDLHRVARGIGMATPTVALALDVFNELGFTVEKGQVVALQAKAPKRSLNESAILARQRRRKKAYDAFYYASQRQLLEEITKVRAEQAAHIPGGDDHGFQRENTRHSRLSPTGSSL
ncbi:single-stranded-DNA-specific exonuclease RecJ [Numidum massiliense]|uniref:single-stranded-DNA-specific exonuclease RecJ n=1 Tax=Numidum massiliense TaxID=1522315 RepID=UPI0006D58410|nr:single-stranded-DNA-specific exonuclease RecJ [Numidum massiliense]